MIHTKFLARNLALTVACVLGATFQLYADEGMWTFHNPPLKQWKEHYNFEPAQEWLDFVRLASVQIGASGGFVSANGLLVTNQHVAVDTLAKISTKDKDYVKDGFHARARKEELKSKDLEVQVLISYEDVTDRVHRAVSKTMDDKVAAEKRKAVMAAIEKESTEKTGLKSTVISLYNGGEYWLYRQKNYKDVRLVFAVEEQVGFFGGEHDNFTYPRFDLDVAFFRVYENGIPIKTPNYFKWSKAGVTENDFVMAIGSPGATARLFTVAQLTYQRDFSNPLLKQTWTSQLKSLESYATRGAEQQRQTASHIRGINNGLKRLIGQQNGLLNSRLFAKKQEDEKTFRAKIAEHSDLANENGSPFEDIEQAYRDHPVYAKRLAYSNLSPSGLGTIGSSIVRYHEQMKKPNDQRYEEFRDSRLESFKFQLLSSAPIYPELEEASLTAWLEDGVKNLGANDVFIKAAIGNAEPSEVVRRAVRETKLADVAVRKALIEGGEDAIVKSTDPMITLARRVEPVIKELRAWQEEKFQSVVSRASEKIANARFVIYGRSLAPDANSNLRISYGRVKGYAAHTTLVPYKTTFYGLFDRAAGFDKAPPFDLAKRWTSNAGKLNLSTPLNFVYSADTIGGNSGSPVINAKGEFVGLNFDSNLEKLSNKYWYIDEEEGSRAVAVHSAGILEALRKIYDAGELVNELEGLAH